jgi:putative oxidoreductase
MKALQLLTRTNDNFAPTIARLTLGLVMFPHGTMHIPAVFAFLAIAAEFAGSIALIAGLFSRAAAAGIAAVMAVAIATVHLSHGFFMNWYGNQKGEGYEYHLLVLGLALIVMIYGAGKVSLDALIARRAA